MRPGGATLRRPPGSLVAVEAARDRPKLLRAVITLGAPARSLTYTLQSRMRDRLRVLGLVPAEIESRITALREDLKALRDLPPGADPGEGQRLLRDLLHVEPADSYQKVGRGLMILYGRDDHLVPHGHRALLRSILSLISGFSFSFQHLQQADHEFLQTGKRGARAPGKGSTTDVARPRHPALG